jgi:alpha/beta superfamily hydrolase
MSNYSRRSVAPYRRCTCSTQSAAAAVRVPFAILLLLLSALACAQDYEREQRWADQILPSLMVGEPIWLQQKNGHKFLALYTEAKNARGAAIVAHGRGWSPDYELYGILRGKLAEAGYTTLAIQLPVLGGGAKIGDYLPTYPDARERFQMAADYLKTKGYKNIAIVSHSLGATMANQYLIDTDDKTVKAWVFVGIINGLEEMFRIKIPVLDVFGSRDWEVTQVGAYERRKQIMKIKGSDQVVVPEALHFFEGREDELTKIIVTFLDQVFHNGNPTAAVSR